MARTMLRESGPGRKQSWPGDGIAKPVSNPAPLHPKEEEMFLRQADIMVIVAILTFILGLITGIQIRWVIP